MQLMFSRADESQGPQVMLEVPGNPRIEPEFLIGRADDCDVQLTGKLISRHHCAIAVDIAARSVRVRDMESRNGTFVNGERVLGTCALLDRDTLTVGSVPLTIRISGDSSFWDNVAERYRVAQIPNRQLNFGSFLNIAHR
jgi:pSer/pThr/pTyr-binding forkhead associated (FHA) protein